MITADQLRAWAFRPVAGRWMAAVAAVIGLHLLAVIGLAAVDPRLISPPSSRPVAPIYLDISPRLRPPQPTPPAASQGPGAPATDQPPIFVRPAAQPDLPTAVAPLQVEAPLSPVRPRTPGRVIPQSWRERCGLGHGDVSEDAWRACRDSFLQAAGPTSPAVRPRGDPAQDFAAQGAARLRAYEARRAPAPTGSGNAGPSATPGSNFGMGEIDRSVVYVQGQRPDTGPD